jgi:mannosidase alpha-like ER degradation enhancer 2
VNRRNLLRLAIAAPVAAGLRFPVFAPGHAGAHLPSQAEASVSDSAGLAARVREEFLHAWNGYKKYAWGYDELRPLSKSARNWHSASLLMTPVDALDTMILMGLDEEAQATAEYIAKNLGFDHDFSVKNFEITIRILGGLLSGHQMTGDARLLALADDLGERLLPAFASKTGMPYMYINLKTGAVRGEVSNPAEIGTLLLEFGTLAKLTHKPAYYEKAKRALVELYQRRSSIGLVGSAINVEIGAWVNTRSHIGGGIDSYYEYLLKSWLLFNDEDCRDMWKQSVAALNEYLAHETESSLWYGRVDMKTGKRVATRYGALDAFLPAVLALGGDLDRARRLQESGYKMWQVAGIEPEAFDYATEKITSPGYPLRPEVMESAYYLYFLTREPRWLEMGRTFFEGLVQHCRTESGYAALRNVETKEKTDNMESFFLAETLKYLYLLFAPPETLDLKKVVFNTEAHPLRNAW